MSGELILDLAIRNTTLMVVHLDAKNKNNANNLYIVMLISYGT